MCRAIRTCKIILQSLLSLFMDTTYGGILVKHFILKIIMFLPLLDFITDILLIIRELDFYLAIAALFLYNSARLQTIWNLFHFCGIYCDTGFYDFFSAFASAKYNFDWIHISLIFIPFSETYFIFAHLYNLQFVVGKNFHCSDFFRMISIYIIFILTCPLSNVMILIYNSFQQQQYRCKKQEHYKPFLTSMFLHAFEAVSQIILQRFSYHSKESLSHGSRSLYTTSLITSASSIVLAIWAWNVRDSASQETFHETNQAQLEKSIQNGDLSQTRKIISSLISRDQVDELQSIITGMLSESILAGQVPTLKYLLSMGADVNSKDVTGNTPLNLACEIKDKEIVKCLLNHSADANISGAKGLRPLVLAVQTGQKDFVELLLARDADVNLVPNILSIVSAEGHVEIVDILIENQADLTSIDSNGSSDLMLAIRRGFDDIAGSLIKGGVDLNQQDNHGENALMISIQSGNNSTSRMLLESGVDLNSQSHLGETAMVLALRDGDTNLANALLDLGADPELSPFGTQVITIENDDGTVEAFGISETVGDDTPDTMI